MQHSSLSKKLSHGAAAIAAGWRFLGRRFALYKALAKLFYSKLTQRPKGPLASGNPVGNPFSDPGVFIYTPDGFTAPCTGGPQHVAWHEINVIFGYKVDAYVVDRIQLDILCQDGSELSLTEELAGWHPFLRRLTAQIPSIPSGWEFDIADPPFATNLTLLYEKNGLGLAQAQALYYAPTKKRGDF